MTFYDKDIMKGASIWFMTVLVAVTCGTGCADETRYRILSFFFDGVPSPQQQKAELTVADGYPEPAVQRRYGEHGPYAAKLCDACHQRGSNKLTVPREELCLVCHVLKLDDKKIHGPLASGGCVICHEPHGSPNRHLLVSDSKEFCLYCHDQNEILKRDAHKGIDAECTVCHDAHGSANEFLLK